MCTPVKQYVQKQRMAMQKQQQESLRQREAERQRYGEARMQVSLVACLRKFQPPEACSYTVMLLARILHMGVEGGQVLALSCQLGVFASLPVLPYLFCCTEVFLQAWLHS